jgi:hypothetical protein
VAIAIVAETCSPFTVLPALMNEYRVPELNVQNGVLKSLSFLFEYIGEMGKDYIYAVTPLLEDALMDRWESTPFVVHSICYSMYGNSVVNISNSQYGHINFIFPCFQMRIKTSIHKMLFINRTLFNATSKYRNLLFFNFKVKFFNFPLKIGIQV